MPSPKGVILAGGSATRLGELTRITNKHLLPVGDYPMIYYPLKALEQAGIKEVCLVTGKEHAERFIALLGDGQVFDRKGEKIFDLDITYRMQVKPAGIADALMRVKGFAHGEKTVVMLGDNIIEGNICEYVEKFSHQERGGRIILREVDNPSAYGVPVFNEAGKIVSIEEKPKEPKSKYAVIGIYMYDAQVFDFIEQLNPSERGELEVSDLNTLYLKNSLLEYDVLKGWWRDAGQSPRELAEISQLIYQTGVNKMDL